MQCSDMHPISFPPLPRSMKAECDHEERFRERGLWFKSPDIVTAHTILRKNTPIHLTSLLCLVSNAVSTWGYSSYHVKTLAIPLTTDKHRQTIFLKTNKKKQKPKSNKQKEITYVPYNCQTLGM